MRILIVAMTESIHTARWVNQLVGQGWDVHLFPAISSEIHPGLREVTVHTPRRPSLRPHPSVRVVPLWPFTCGVRAYQQAVRYLTKLAWPVRQQLYSWLTRFLEPAQHLARVMRRLKPDIVHSLEIQHAGYLTLHAGRLNGGLPPWIVTNWGSDVFFFGRLASHAPMIADVLSACDWYSCECHRDVALARRHGLRGQVLPVFPNAGGFDLAAVQELRSPGPTSDRRWILLKGYQNWAGRAQVALRALELCSRELQGYQIGMYGAYGEILWRAEFFTRNTGVPVTILPPCSHDEMLAWFGRSRVYLGLSMSDGICTSMLEAMVMGAFPIQSHTACADEWLVPGETGMIVPPEDPHIVADAVRQALTDDVLVDAAAEKNYRLATQRLDQRVIQPMVVEIYKRVLESPNPVKARELETPQSTQQRQWRSLAACASRPSGRVQA
jgi:glycosyltransferase involved in cell wall biosynthesis